MNRHFRMPSMANLAIRLTLTLLLASVCTAQSIVATNSTDTPDYGNGIELVIAHGGANIPAAVFHLTPLTGPAGKDVPSNGLNGVVLVANTTNFLTIDSNVIALVTCDALSGFVQPSDVFAAAEDSNATAIVFYTENAEWCQPSGFDSYRWLYTLTGRNDSARMLEQIDDLSGGGAHSAYGRIASRDVVQSTTGQANSGNSDTSSNNNGTPTNPLGPSPSTAVAMIILYSITGVITALFLIIIITGAVRAHRHPERYGPRNIVGRPRQGRARGIARAMLDSIPIVKFGDRTEQPVKPGEVELEHGRVEDLGDRDTATQHIATVADATPRDTTAQPSNGGNENSIATAAAVATERGDAAPNDENQGCSICTEDFQVGEDQRVLPCDHRFHPACIDPWLLNVSGTCPLCRIDLRSQEEDGGELDEHGNPRTEAELAPPLDGGDHRRISMRRSLVLGLMGIPRPERMTREERRAALRQYRQQAQEQAAADTPAEEESNRRRRLRNVFRIRTRRTGGEEGRVQEAPASQQDSTPVENTASGLNDTPSRI